MISIQKVQAHENPITKACCPKLNMFTEIFNANTPFEDQNDLKWNDHPIFCSQANWTLLHSFRKLFARTLC